MARLRAAAPAVLADGPVRFAYLFGSRTTDTWRADSDVDVAVMLDETSDDPLGTSLDVADALSRGADVACVEVATLNDAPLRFAGRVLRQRLVIFSRDEPGRVDYESLTGRMADDVEIWARQMDREILAATAAGKR